MGLFFFSPWGRHSKRPIEELLRQILGGYVANCKHSIFISEKGGDESNSAISFSREGVRALFGQEVGRRQKWSNAAFKRRADGGREGGTPKYSNVFRENDPVYTPMSGRNEPCRLERAPGKGESDRCLIPYLPNKFCNAEELMEEPLSRRRFRRRTSM